ncbi:hypothetical protein ABLE93_05045 [Xanthobacter sp. KR7-65]|uniref:hypothetical protein n=1 Tax=Xanthobacter sp. KR7-65 TaxID=3156612 RepID=UPI0032B3D35A
MISASGAQGLLGFLRFLTDLAGVEDASAGALIGTALLGIGIFAVFVLVIWLTYSKS